MDVVTPLYISDKKVGNVFFGQFLFDDEVPDKEFFKAKPQNTASTNKPTSKLSTISPGLAEKNRWTS